MGWRSGQRCSQDLRDRVLSAIDGGMAVRLAAATFGVSPSYIYKALMRRRPTGDSGPEPGPCAAQANGGSGNGAGRIYEISTPA